MINQEGLDGRRIYLNVPHSANVKPSWTGESVGHYEGDTLVVDTIGINDKTYIDKRFRMIDDGNMLEANIRIEDPGAFTMPWNAVQRWRRVQQGPMYERACVENPFDLHIQDTEPVPHADTPDFYPELCLCGDASIWISSIVGSRQFKACVRMFAPLLVNCGFELFLSAARSSRVAASGWRGRGCWMAHLRPHPAGPAGVRLSIDTFGTAIAAGAA
jgi:hypothetical protein